LTGQDGTSILASSDKIQTFSSCDGGSEIYLTTGKATVKESIDEIEIMLAGKGAEVKRADPHARDFIGSKPELFRDPTSLNMREGI
jgi:hypothetical protein